MLVDLRCDAAQLIFNVEHVLYHLRKHRAVDGHGLDLLPSRASSWPCRTVAKEARDRIQEYSGVSIMAQIYDSALGPAGGKQDDKKDEKVTLYSHRGGIGKAARIH